MIAQSDRRGFLGGLAGLSLVTGSAVAAPDLDAELLALGRLWREANAVEKVARDREWDAESATRRPEPPEAIFVQPGDPWAHAPGVFTRYGRGHGSGRQWYACIIDQLRRPEIIWSDLPADIRASEIVDAWDGWRQEWDAAEKASGLTAAREEHQRRIDETTVFRVQIAASQAHTFAGLRLKAEVVREGFGDADEAVSLKEIEREIAYDLKRMSPADTVALTIVRDLLAMGGVA